METPGSDGAAKLGVDDFRKISQGLNVGVAVIETTNWTVVFENAAMFKWFPPAGDDAEPISERIPGLQTETALERAKNGRPYSVEVEARVGAREIPVRFETRLLDPDSDEFLVLEGHDISKQKQTEYMLESYSEMSERNARELQREKERAERLLLNIMPRSVYEEMKDFGTVTPQLFQDASILMLDFVGSTEMAVSDDPVALIGELNDMFVVFDRIADQFGCERIRTVGDAYVAVSGLPDAVPDHAENVARMALRMVRYLERRNSAHTRSWRCRIGINSGPVIGSIVGIQKYVYDIFGPGINLAARMEAISEPMKITVSEGTAKLLDENFELTDLGEVEVKGFDKMHAYSLDRETPRMRW